MYKRSKDGVVVSGLTSPDGNEKRGRGEDNRIAYYAAIGPRDTRRKRYYLGVTGGAKDEIQRGLNPIIK